MTPLFRRGFPLLGRCFSSGSPFLSRRKSAESGDFLRCDRSIFRKRIERRSGRGRRSLARAELNGDRVELASGAEPRSRAREVPSRALPSPSAPTSCGMKFGWVHLGRVAGANATATAHANAGANQPSDPHEGATALPDENPPGGSPPLGPFPTPTHFSKP